MSDVFVIVNPNAANGSLGLKWPALNGKITRHFGAHHASLTQHRGHAITLARDAAEAEASLVISVGGDGTHSEVITGLMTAKCARRPRLAVLTQGTGGDLRRSLGLSGGLEQSLEELEHLKAKTTDVGVIRYQGDSGREERYFLNIASCGISGLVDHFVDRTTKKFGGKASYFAATLRALVKYQYPKITLTVDDKASLTANVLLIALANGKSFGGGMKIAPNALIDDGLLDIVIAHKAPRLATLMCAADIYRGRHLRQPWFSELRGSKVALEARDEVLLDVDGEPLGKLPAEIEILPGAIDLLRS